MEALGSVALASVTPELANIKELIGSAFESISGSIGDGAEFFANIVESIQSSLGSLIGECRETLMLKGLVTYMSGIVGFISVDLVGAGAKYLGTLSAAPPEEPK